MVTVELADLVTRSGSMPTERPAWGHLGHEPWSHVAGPAEVTGSFHGRAAGSLLAGIQHRPGPPHQVDEGYPGDHLFGVVASGGIGTTTARQDLLHLAQGDVLLNPRVPDRSQLQDTGAAVVGVPWPAITAQAEISTGLPTAVQFDLQSPVSTPAARTWARTVEFICAQLLSPEVTELSALLVQELTTVAAAAMLAAFPHTTMTIADLPGPGSVPASAVRDAAAFIDAYAAQPITLAEITQIAGVTSPALQEAFRGHYGITPLDYLRRIRLERAHAELSNADPATSPTIGAVARRWGWPSPAQFVGAYRQRFTVPPSYTRQLPPPGRPNTGSRA